MPYKNPADRRAQRRKKRATETPAQRKKRLAAHRKAVTAYQKRRIEREPDWLRRRHLHHAYGISLEQEAEMLAAQNERCAICGLALGDDRAIDHDHATGRVRALLCGLCNRGLGNFKDDPRLLQRAIDYLASF